MDLDAILREQFLNKRIHVKVRGRDQRGKLLPLNQNIYDIAGGVYTFIGHNVHLNVQLQVNINNHPIEVEHITHITLAPERKKIRL